MKLRKHQQECVDYFASVAAGQEQLKSVLMDVTPGGGKSLIPLLAFHELHQADLIDRVAWFVPRESLQEQGALDFSDPMASDWLGAKYSIMESTNACDPCRGTNGFISTFQAVGMDQAGINLAEIQTARYLVVLDEFHHLQANGVWHRRLQPIIDASVAQIYMTGTCERGDGEPIAFIEYQEVSHALDA